MEERQQKTLDVLPSSTFFWMRQTVPTGHASGRDAIWCLKINRPMFSQHVCKNAQLPAKHKARSHCLFASVNPQKILIHGNLAWQHLLVVSPTMTTYHWTLSSVSCCFPMCFAQELHASWRLMQRVSTKPGALDRPFRSVSDSQNLLLKLRNEFKGEVALWLRRESPRLAHLCLSTLQINRTTLSQSRHCGITVTCRMLIAYAVPGGFWPSRPWKITCWSKIWSAIILPCGVQ